MPSMESSGFETTFFWQATTNATPLNWTADDYFSCDVWSMPSRFVLQILCFATLLLNISAAIVVFGVPTHVRGPHVSFLFVCVRILNMLDIWQCVILFFFPIFVPSDCQPSTVYCDITGYLFTTATLFSPLVAIVMAVDRAAAVYFHVQYKANPRTEIKYLTLAALLGFYGVYLILPCFTSFGSYVAVPWLSLCCLEWGVVDRSFDLILISITFVLIVILIMANLAILIKMRMRKKQIDRMKGLSNKEHKRKTKQEKRSEAYQTIPLRKMHRSADDIIDISSEDCITFAAPTFSSLSKRVGKQVPPPLQLHLPTNEEESKIDVESLSAVRSVSPLVTPNTPPYLSAKRMSTKRKNTRPKSLMSPLTATTILSPISPFEAKSVTQQPSSPLILLSADGARHRLTTKSSKAQSLNRSSSADNVLNNGSSKFTFPKQHTPTLLRRVLDYPTGKLPDMDNQSNYTASSDENDTCRRKATLSSTSSYFSFAFVSTKTGIPKRNKRRSRKMRRNVSKITKMTTTICLVFIILYFPFLIRKLVQLVPSDYRTIYIPSSVEIATLFGPFLSSLCNPIIYVFLNPHYKRHCMRLLRRIDKKLSTCSKVSCCFGLNQTACSEVPKMKADTTIGISSPTDNNLKSHPSLEDVFLPNKQEKHSTSQAHHAKNHFEIRNKNVFSTNIKLSRASSKI